MIIAKEQVEVMIEKGKQKGLTGKDVIDALVRKGYEPEGVNVQAIKQSITPAAPVETESVSFMDRIKETGQDIKQTFQGIADSSMERADNIADLEMKQESGESNAIGTTLKQTGQALGAGADAIGQVFKGGVKVLASQEREDKLKSLLGDLAAEVSPIINQMESVQQVKDWYNTLPDNKKEAIDAAGGAVALATEFIGVGAGKQVVKEAAKRTVDIAETGMKIGNEVIDTTADIAGDTFQAGKKLLPKSEDIMNRVARLTPTQANKFKQISGKTHGQYLKETGNFGTPDEIIKRESEKFTQSIKSVDDSLDKLDGNFNDGIIDDVLDELQTKAISVSTKNVPSPYLSRVNELVAKNTESGLSMSEINEMKRLYEKNVKLGYNKLIDAEKIQRATYLDEALREWQIAKAEELGFKNLRELNKQTQTSKQLINSLGEQVVGKTGLNDINLTDWIMLSGGNPTAVGGFLTKKFFSSKKIQSKLAELLNDVEVKPTVKPNITQTKQVQPQQLETIKSTSVNNNIPVRKVNPVSVSNAPDGNFINVGMDTNIGGKITELDILNALPSDIKIINKTIKQSGTEPTFIAQFSRPLTEAEHLKLTQVLKQDAIPQLSDGIGTMTNIGKKSWGDFNPEYFLDLK